MELAGVPDRVPQALASPGYHTRGRAGLFIVGEHHVYQRCEAKQILTTPSVCNGRMRVLTGVLLLRIVIVRDRVGGGSNHRI